MEKEAWRNALKNPDWYIKLENFLGGEILPVVDDKEIKKRRHEFYETVEEMLNTNQIPLASEGPSYDADRKSIDTIVIHHTSEDPHIKLSKLSAIGFVRQYGKDYLKNEVLGYDVKGKPIWSNHFKDGRMVFYAYHWLVRVDGKAERLLEDNQIGWQSGVWDVNTRSVAIALSGDYTDNKPTGEQIESIRKIIEENYTRVNTGRILGHREINKRTTCPGDKFLGTGGWKNQLA